MSPDVAVALPARTAGTRTLFLLLRPIVVSTGISEVPYMSFRLFGIYYPGGDPYRQSMEWCIHCPAFAASEDLGSMT
ncbi:hypothetical protein EMIT0373P_50136 [Pseudomonas chlororaphis]